MPMFGLVAELGCGARLGNLAHSTMKIMRKTYAKRRGRELKRSGEYAKVGLYNTE